MPLCWRILCPWWGHGRSRGSGSIPEPGTGAEPARPGRAASRAGIQGTGCGEEQVNDAMAGGWCPEVVPGCG